MGRKPNKPTNVKDVHDWITFYHDMTAKKSDWEDEIKKIETRIQELEAYLSELHNDLGVIQSNLGLFPRGISQIRERYIDWDDAIDKLLEFRKDGKLSLSGSEDDWKFDNSHDDHTRFYFQGDGRFDREFIMKAVRTTHGILTVGIADEGNEKGYIWLTNDIADYVI